MNLFAPRLSTACAVLALAAGLAPAASAAPTPDAAVQAPPAASAAESNPDLTACTAPDLKDEAIDAAIGSCRRALAGPLAAADQRRTHLAFASLLAASYQLTEASGEVERLLRLDPNDASALVIRARLHDARGEGEAARADLAAALKADPRNADALELRGAHSRDAGDMAKAQADFDAAVAAAPSRQDLRVERILLISAGGDRPASMAALDAAGLDRAHSLSIRGLVLENLKQPKEALKVYDEALKVAPQDATILYVKASLLNDLGRTKDALAECDAALALRPKFGEALRLKARILLDAEQWADARAAAQAAADAFSGDMDARVLLAQAEGGLDQDAAGLKILDDVRARNPGNRDAVFRRAQALARLKRNEEAVADYTTYLAGDDDAGARFNRGLLYVDLKAFAKAKADFEASARLDPKDPDALVHLGLVQSELKEPQAEIESYKAALGRDPGNVTAMQDLAVSYADLDDCKTAVGWYEQALRKDPKRTDLRQGAAWCLRKLGQDSAADRQAEQAVEIDPSSAWGWADQAERLSDKGRTAQALDLYTRGLSHSPKDVTLLLGRARVWETVKDNKHALADYDAAVAAAPDSADALDARGLFHWRQDDNDLALVDFEREIKLGEAGELGVYNSGLAWRDKGRYDQALRQFDAYLKLHPQDTDALLQKGRIYHDLEDDLLAVEYYSEVIRLDPKIAAAWQGRSDARKSLNDPAADADHHEALRLDKSS